MANPSTASYAAASTTLDEVVRLASDSARRTSDTAHAALEIGRRVCEQSGQLNNELFALWTTSLEAGLQNALDVQRAMLGAYRAMV
jgi:hypothetical protein